MEATIQQLNSYKLAQTAANYEKTKSTCNSIIAAIAKSSHATYLTVPDSVET